jgi:hypothetical protein
VAVVATAQVSGTPPPEVPGVLRISVVSRDGNEPLPFSTVGIDGVNLKRFTDTAGRITVAGLPPGSYQLTAREIGFAPWDSSIAVGPGTTDVRVALSRVAIRIARITVRARRPDRCIATGFPDSAIDPELAALFGELQKNADHVRLLDEQYRFRYTREEINEWERNGRLESARRRDTVAYISDQYPVYRPGRVIYEGVNVRRERTQYMRLPVFDDLADSTFQRTHCFLYGGEERRGDTTFLRVDFQPATAIRGPDVEGSVFLDAARYIVRRMVVRLTHPEAMRPRVLGLTATTTFREIVPFLLVFDHVRSDQPLTGDGESVVSHETYQLLTFQFLGRLPGQ